MYEKESFIFHRKIDSRECALQGPKLLKIDFDGGWRAVHVPRYMAHDF